MQFRFSATVIPFLFSSLAAAQTANANLTGFVNDPSGAAVPDAQVTLTNSATSVEITSRTNSTGFYSFPYIVPGSYRLTVEAAGFQRQSTSGKSASPDSVCG